MAAAVGVQPQPVRIGDTICLYCDDGPGFVYSHVSSTAHMSVAVSVQRDRDMKNPNVANIHAAAFRVLAPNKFKAQKKLQQLQKEIGDIPSSQLPPSQLEKLGILDKNYRAECEDNRQEQMRQKDKPLEYGQIIQLQHMFTKRFLSVSTTLTSQVEPTNMQVELRQFNAKHGRFKVLPRYKVRAIGDRVMVGDQIQLESAKTEGQFIHCSRLLFGEQQSTEVAGRELNLSATQSALTVLIHYSPHTEYGDDTLRAGSMIRLYHREVEAYLAAEGSFAEKEPVENVHLRVRPPSAEKPHTLLPSTSAITYWQIEMESLPASGEVMRWEQRCRLRHACTRQYLALLPKENDTRQYELSLSTHTGLSTVFRMFPVIQEGDHITFDSYCRIEHVESGQWLHALTTDYPRKANRQIPPSATSMERLEWDDAPLKQIGSSEQMNYDDAFTIQEVQEQHVDIFNYVAGMIPVIQQYIAIRNQNRQVTTKMAEKLKKALIELGDFQIVNGEAVKNRQKLLRNLRLLDLLVELLKRYDPRCSDAKNQKVVCCHAYRALELYLVGDSRKNELYVAKYIPFYQTQIGQDLNAETMVMELVRDNRKIVDRIEEAQIDIFVDFLKEKRDFRYLDFLGVLCVCDGVAIPSNQVYIAKKILQETRSIVFLTEVGSALKPARDFNQVFVSQDQGKTWTALREFSANQERRPSAEFCFLQRQLDLFGKLCYGRNKYVTDVITKELCYLTWDEAFICLKDESLPDHLRANYCEIITGLFVDVDDNRSVLDKLCLSYVFTDVDEKPYSKAAADPQEAITGVRMPFFPKLRDWIAKFMGMNEDMTASKIGHNQLVEQVLRLVHYLVRFGYYANIEDIQVLLRPLLSVLDGRNDKPFEGAKERSPGAQKQYEEQGRFVHNPQNTAVVNAKHMAMEVLEVLFNFRFNIRLERFIYQFKAVQEGRSDVVYHLPSQSGPLALSKRATRRGRDATGMTEFGQLMSSNCDVLADEHLMEFANRQLEGILRESAYFEDKNLVAILKDLSDYQYDKMVVKSMGLLTRYFSAHSTLFDRAVQAQVLIQPKSVAVYRKIDQTLPTLRRLVGAKLTANQERSVMELIDEYTELCCLESDVEGTLEPHRMNQTILYNFGILDDIFDVLDKEIDIRLAQYAGLRQIFEKCFRFLRAMARGNAVVQARLFDRMDKLLTVRGAEAALADALTEVFTGNQEMCLKIRSYQVQGIVELLALHQLDASEFLDLLKAVVKVEELDLPLKRNQVFVMTNINQNRAKLAWIIEKDAAEKRKRLLKAGDLSDPELNYLLRMVDLLATCAEGENRFIESICQNIFLIEDLLEILNDPEISIPCKRPYLRFFVWVYLNTAGGKVESGASELDHDENMWRYIEMLNQSLLKLRNSLKGLERGSKKSMAMALKPGRTPSRQALEAAMQDKERRIVATARVVDEDFLLYFFEGVLPFLQVFYTDYYQPVGDQHQMEVKTSQELVLNLLHISDEISHNVGDENQFQLLRSTVTTLVNQETLELLQQAEYVTMVTKFQQLSVDVEVDVRSDAMKKYESEFNREEKLNDRLNQFVVNFKKAYEGPNTVRVQIGYPSDTQYCEDGEDEDLPLGKEFQDHVSCFSNRNGDVDPHASKLVQQLFILYSDPNLGRLSESARLEQERTSVASLQVLRAMIHNQIMLLPEDDDSGQSKGYQRTMERVRRVQDALNSFQSPLKIVPLLSHHNDEIVRETLGLLAAILYRGNRNVQYSFENYFLNTREETFFIDVQGRLQRSLVATRERRALLAQHRGKVNKSKKMMETLRLRTQGKKAAARTSLAAAGQVSDEIELKELELQEGVREVEDTAEALRFKDDGYIELVLRIMGFMCDGHNRVLQDYLRVQPDNIKSLNLVAETTSYLQLFYGSINEDNVAVVTQVFDTLIEFISGNQENQAVAFDRQLIDAINDVLRLDGLHWKDSSLVGQLKQAALIVLQAMIEENDPQTIRLSKGILETVHIEALYENMQKAVENAQQNPGDAGEADRTLAFTIHHILLSLRDFGQIHWGKKWNFRYIPNPEQVDAHAMLKDETLSVEVLCGDELQKVYFKVKNKDALREEVKEQLKWNISRESPTDKLRDFLEWAQDIRSDISFQQRVRKHRLASMLIAGRVFWYWSLLLLTIALNVFILASWTAPRDFEERLPEVENYFFPVLISLGAIHSLLSLCMLVTFYLSNWNNFVFPTIFYTIFKLETPKKSHSSINWLGLQSMYFVLFLTFSILSLFFDGYFYCFHLFIIVVNNDILGRVLQSITRNGKSLLWVAALMLVIIYVYAIVSFAFLRQSFDRNEGLFCENLGQCFVTSLKYGLLSGGGLGDALRPGTYSFHEPGLKIIFDLSFFIVITVIALNIVFGIIVDTFSELRDEKSRAQADMASVCFICGNPSFEFDKRGEGFDKHVKQEHNIWSYLFFFIHLNSILPNDYTSIEEFVAQKLSSNEIDFFPANRALSLAETEDKNAQELTELKRMVQQLLARQEQEDAEQRRQKERQEHKTWEKRHLHEAHDEEDEAGITAI